LIIDKLKKESKILDKCENYDYSAFITLINEAEKVGRSWSGSWLGYHSRVYYKNFQTPPANAHFSTEWGINNPLTSFDSIGMLGGSTGDWIEYTFEDVTQYINNLVDDIDWNSITQSSIECKKIYENTKYDILSILYAQKIYNKDEFIKKLIDELEEMKLLTKDDFLKGYIPQGTLSTRDTRVEKKLETPPHIAIICSIYEIIAPFTLIEQLKQHTTKIIKYLENLELTMNEQKKKQGLNIFIGHGRSNDWRDLKDFIQDRLKLPYDEFNRVPIAGTPNTIRLNQMLDQAGFAFLIMSAEDELSDGKYQARMNVIHEVGLFQGRLGFEKAIVLLEEGCEEFSNIQGLGQIRYPKNNISAIFEEIRKVLEREKFL
jgi:predicted nucleotide-binding protein